MVTRALFTGILISASSMDAVACDNASEERILLLDHYPNDVRDNEVVLRVSAHLVPIPIALKASENGKPVSPGTTAEPNMYVSLSVLDNEDHPELKGSSLSMTYRQEECGPILKQDMTGMLVGYVSQRRVVPVYWRKDGSRLSSLQN